MTSGPLDPATIADLNEQVIREDLADLGASSVADYVVAYIGAAMRSSEDELFRLTAEVENLRNGRL